MELGILLPIFSLPSKYGIGDFGYEAYEFIDILKQYNIKYWEILPINASGISPYSPTSYYALNENYISLAKLQDMHLLDNVREKEKSNRIKYDNYKEQYYKIAYQRFTPNNDYLKFCQNDEIKRYAKYMSNKHNEEENYYLFLQYILDKEWNELKNYAHQNGIKIIGDMPIYPDFDSCEVTNYPEYYELENGRMKYVSGASPDYFNENGQKWGHPLYNFNYMAKDNFKYLIKRYQEFLNKYDIIRIDHFRAFDTYYKIPINSSPKEGWYEEGPGSKFFDTLFKYTTWNRFIVEDLGDIRKETEQLRDKYHFTKMKIIEYTLDTTNKKDNYEDTPNMVIYTGNHDNNTIIGWYNNLSQIKQTNLQAFLKEHNCQSDRINISLIKYCLQSPAHLAIFPVQDIIGLDENSRINLPGYSNDENWSWELLDFNEFKQSMELLKEELLKNKDC